MKKHILVISQYFYPEQFRINDMCKEWVKKGYEVTVITGIPNYPMGKIYENYGYRKNRTENYEGINIIRIPLIPRGQNSIGMVSNYLSFMTSGYFWQKFTKIEADFVFIFEVSPMTQALPGVWYAKKNKIPCYIYVQDLWPENVQIMTGINNKAIIGPIDKMVDYIYKNCDKIFVTSPSFKKEIEKRVSISNEDIINNKVEFWPQYAEDFYEPVGKLGRKNTKLNIVFTGNVGKAQGLEILPKVAEKIKQNNDNVIFTIIGDGRYLETLMKEVKDNNLQSYFEFKGRIDSRNIPFELSKNDVAFVSFMDNPLFEKTIPAKLQSYMACGMPILAVANGETKRVVDESKSGLVSNIGDTESLYENIITFLNIDDNVSKQMAINSLDYCKTNFDKNKLMDYFDKYYKENENV